MKTLNENKASLNPKSTDVDYAKKEVTPMEEAVMFDNGPDTPDNQLSKNAVKGGAWLLGIVGVFAMCLLIAWAVDLHHSPTSSLSSRSVARPTAVMPNAHHAASKVVANSPKFVAVIKQVKAPTIKTLAPTPAERKSIKLSNTSFSNNISKADQDRIEREALEVIHGDFGNNPGRKEKLGADYAAVQAKVNELLHI